MAMMGRHRAAPMTIFAFAIALALVTAVVVHSQVLPPTVVISIQNNFPTYNLTVQCGSDVPARIQQHVLLPKEVYMFHSDPEMEHLWNCALSTAKPGHFCSGLYRGEFLMWRSYDLPGTAAHLCSTTKCLWFVDASGLSLIQHPGGEPVHIYDWPTHVC